MYASILGKGERVEHTFAPGRSGWLQIVRGDVTLNGEPLTHGDGAAITDEDTITIEGNGDEAEFLLFDLK